MATRKERDLAEQYEFCIVPIPHGRYIKTAGFLLYDPLAADLAAFIRRECNKGTF